MFRHKTLVYLSGLIWFFVGLYLLPLGLHLITAASKSSAYGDFTSSLPLFYTFHQSVGSADSLAVILIACGLVIGYLKGQMVLGKSVKRMVDHILSLPNPAQISKVYTKAYYILIGSMMLIGMAIKVAGVPSDIRGLIDVAIGSALINGAMLYFRAARSV